MKRYNSRAWLKRGEIETCGRVSLVRRLQDPQALRFRKEAMPRCLVENAVKGPRVKYNSTAAVAAKEKDNVKVNIQVILIVSW